MKADVTLGRHDSRLSRTHCDALAIADDLCRALQGHLNKAKILEGLRLDFYLRTIPEHHHFQAFRAGTEQRRVNVTTATAQLVLRKRMTQKIL